MLFPKYHITLLILKKKQPLAAHFYKINYQTQYISNSTENFYSANEKLSKYGVYIIR